MKKLLVVLLMACGPVDGEPCARVDAEPCTEKTKGLTGFFCACDKRTCRPGDEGVWRETTCR